MKFIQLTQGMMATVDDCDYAWLNSFKWHAVSKKGKTTWYAIRRIGPRSEERQISMHQMILPNCETVDHIDGNGIDNRRQNLRPATRTQNLRNRQKCSNSTTSKYKGVSWKKTSNKWEAYIGAGKTGKFTWLGLFDDEEDAARAYDKVAAVRFGAFARFNLPHEMKNSSLTGISAVSALI